MLRLLNEESQPNINELSILVRNLDALALNVKAFGYDLARRLGERVPPPVSSGPRVVGIASKPSTQADLESDWAAHWCAELQIPLIFHRKVWEFAFVLQALYDHGMLVEGKRGLGFGCGLEPMASYFASLGLTVLTTDLPPDDARAAGWSQNSQHAPTPEHARDHRLVDRETFERRVQHRFVDMNAIPDDLRGFDFTWSICALEHLGSIQNGLTFIENAAACLAPGGVAVHTMEFNINPDGPTVDHWPTVFFQRRHIESLARKLQGRGYRVATLDFDTGNRPLDQFIDVPPWHDGVIAPISKALGQPLHLKVAADGFIVTCFGLIVSRP